MIIGSYSALCNTETTETIKYVFLKIIVNTLSVIISSTSLIYITKTHSNNWRYLH